MASRRGLVRRAFEPRGRARLIAKIYEVDPLLCSRRQGPMRAIAPIETPAVVKRILEHLGEWSPREDLEASGPGPPDWPPGAQLPLTYHPVPDIA